MKRHTPFTESHPMLLHFFSDPGHGWLGVPFEFLRYLDLDEKISKFSYIDSNTGFWYLEEDCDAGLFIEEIKRRGIPFNVSETVEPNEDSWIRSLPHVEPI